MVRKICAGHWQTFGTNTKVTTAREGNKIPERANGAPTVADASIAAAQRVAFAITYFRCIPSSSDVFLTPYVQGNGCAASAATVDECINAQGILHRFS